MALQAPVRLAIKQILFATDFSLVSDAAVPFAVEVARQFGSRIHVLHVIAGSPLLPGPDAAPIVLDYESVQTVEQRMKALLKSESFTGVPHDGRMRRGADVWAEVAAVIESDNIDLVVVGTHGREGLKQVVFGSVAEQVFRTAPCPVLVVGPRVARTPAPVFRELLFATDLSPNSLRALPFVQAFAEENQASLTVAHVSNENADDQPAQMLSRESLLKWMSDLIPPQKNVEHVVLFGPTADKILELAASRQCDLVLLGAHHASSFAAHVPGAVAHRIVAEAHCPVLTVHWHETAPVWY